MSSQRKWSLAVLKSVGSVILGAPERLLSGDALTQAQDDLRLASVKYKLGTMSRLSYQSAEDAVKTAEINVRLAELTVAQNYTACQWAEQGVLTLPTGV